MKKGQCDGVSNVYLLFETTFLNDLKLQSRLTSISSMLTTLGRRLGCQLFIWFCSRFLYSKYCTRKTNWINCEHTSVGMFQTVLPLLHIHISMKSMHSS